MAKEFVRKTAESSHLRRTCMHFATTQTICSPGKSLLLSCIFRISHEHTPHLLPLARRGIGLRPLPLHSHTGCPPDGRQSVHTAGMVGREGRHGVGARCGLSFQFREHTGHHLHITPRFHTYHTNRCLGMELSLAPRTAAHGMPRKFVALGNIFAETARTQQSLQHVEDAPHFARRGMGQ